MPDLLKIDYAQTGNSIRANALGRREGERGVRLAVNSSTRLCLEAWERTNNPHLKGDQMTAFKLSSLENRVNIPGQKPVRNRLGKAN